MYYQVSAWQYLSLAKVIGFPVEPDVLFLYSLWFKSDESRSFSGTWRSDFPIMGKSVQLEGSESATSSR